MGIPLGAWALRLLAGLLVALLATGCTPPKGTGTGGTVSGGHLLIAEVFTPGREADGSDQYIRLHNPTGAPVSLSGWSVGDGKVRAVFPAGAQIGAEQSLYIGRSEAGFRKVMGVPPAYVWSGAGTTASPALNGGAAFLMGATSGAVVLRDASGREVDTVIWGAAPTPALAGWKGRTVAAPARGEVLDRARQESGWSALGPGPYVPDTDTAADWKQGTAWMDLRVLRPGQTWFGSPTYTVRNLTAYASPDATYQVLTGVVEKARRTLDVTIYDLTLPPLAEKLAAAARRGVAVRVLINTSSSVNLDDAERYAARLVASAGGQVRWIVNDPGRGITSRYVYNHAKYAVADGQTTMGHT